MSRQRNDRETEVGNRRPQNGLVPSLEAMAALACGCLSTGRFAWQGPQLWRLFCMWLATDIMLGCGLRALVALKGMPPMRERYSRVMLPFAEAESPGQRLADALASLLRPDRDEAQRDALVHGSSALCAACVMLVLATFMGREALAVAGAVLLGGVLFVVVAGPRRERLASWLAGWQVAAAWVLGGVALAPVRPTAIGVALLAGVGAAILRCRDRTVKPAPWARYVTHAVWLGAVGVLLLARQPIPAVIVALMALSVVAADANTGQRVRTKPLGRRGWVVAQLVMALAMAYWS